jgi:hypothetical protein
MAEKQGFKVVRESGCVFKQETYDCKIITPGACSEQSYWVAAKCFEP